MQPVDIYLIRGLARESIHWGEFANLLKKEKFVNALHFLDLPGAGKFNQLTSPLTIQENAQFLLTQINSSQDIPKVIVSISLGAMVAIEMALTEPQKFKKIYVINSSFSNLSPIYHRLQLKGFKQILRVAGSKNLVRRETEILKMVSRSPNQWPGLMEGFTEAAQKRPFHPINLIRQLFAAARYRIPNEAPFCPIVVMNSLGDEMVHPSCSDQLAKHWGLKQMTHPWAGHDISIDDPEWIIKSISSDLFSGEDL